jgi:hypothetical protein
MLPALIKAAAITIKLPSIFPASHSSGSMNDTLIFTIHTVNMKYSNPVIIKKNDAIIVTNIAFKPNPQYLTKNKLGIRSYFINLTSNP